MPKAPAFQLYVRDWLTDTQLRQCSRITQSIWIDMLCHMWLAPVQGELAGTIDSLARLINATPDEIETALDELKKTGAADVDRHTQSATRHGKVTDRHEKVTVTNRRMAKVGQERKSNAERAKQYRMKKTAPRNAESNGGIQESHIPSASASASASAKTAEEGTAAAASLTKNPTEKPAPRHSSGQAGEPEFAGPIKPLGAAAELAGALSHLQECFRAAKARAPKIEPLDLEAFRDRIFRDLGCGRDGLNFARSFTDGDFVEAWCAYRKKKPGKPQYRWTATWVWNARSNRMEAGVQAENKALKEEQAREIEDERARKLVEDMAEQSRIKDERAAMEAEFAKLPPAEQKRIIREQGGKIFALIWFKKKEQNNVNKD